MKILTYKIAGHTDIYNPKTMEVEQKLSLAEVVVENPTNEQIENAVAIAYSGEIAVNDDGQAESVAEPTTEDRVAELEEALEMILSGVTE